MTSREFAALRERVNKLVDKLGRPIDPDILDTVAILQAHSIHTIGSCEGHADRPTGGPYVLFSAPNAKKYDDAKKTLPEQTGAEYRRLRKQAIMANNRQAQKLLRLLDGFYTHRIVPVNQRLIIEYYGSTFGELMCQGAGLANIQGPEQRADLLKKNQAEMRAFTDYLIALKVKTPRAA